MSNVEMKSERLMSLDALRGADMLCIMGFSGVVVALCSLLGMKGCWLATQMSHVAWEGFRHHDTIFPLFLFLAGVSWPFSFAGQVERGRTTWQIVRKVLVRAAALVLLGLAYGSLFSLKPSTFRYDSVLAHIGICWAGAALIYCFVRSWKTRLAICAALLVGYWLLVCFIPAPDLAAVLASTDPAVAKKVTQYAAWGTGNFSPVGSLACWCDRMFCVGVRNELIFNADGTLAKLTGVVTASLGVLSGELLRAKSLSGNRKALLLAGAGAVSLGLVFAWQPWCPVIKKIWTPTFVLAAASYSFFALALFYWIVDVKGCRRWTFFFRVIGMNSITIYMLMRIVNFNAVSRFFFGGVAAFGASDWSSFVILSGQVAVEWLVLWYLYRNRTFLKV